MQVQYYLDSMCDVAKATKCVAMHFQMPVRALTTLAFNKITVLIKPTCILICVLLEYILFLYNWLDFG